MKFVIKLSADTGVEQHQKDILIESEVYDDIVMESFKETYKNLTLKTQGINNFLTSSFIILIIFI